MSNLHRHRIGGSRRGARHTPPNGTQFFCPCQGSTPPTGNPGFATATYQGKQQYNVCTEAFNAFPVVFMLHFYYVLCLSLYGSTELRQCKYRHSCPFPNVRLDSTSWSPSFKLISDDFPQRASALFMFWLLCFVNRNLECKLHTIKVKLYLQKNLIVYYNTVAICVLVDGISLILSIIWVM